MRRTRAAFSMRVFCCSRRSSPRASISRWRSALSSSLICPFCSISWRSLARMARSRAFFSSRMRCRLACSCALSSLCRVFSSLRISRKLHNDGAQGQRRTGRRVHAWATSLARPGWGMRDTRAWALVWALDVLGDSLVALFLVVHHFQDALLVACTAHLLDSLDVLLTGRGTGGSGAAGAGRQWVSSACCGCVHSV